MNKHIPGYSSYLATDDGRIISLSRCPWPKKAKGLTKRERELRIQNHRQGYKRVSLVDDSGEAKTRFVHQLVALAFLGAPNEGQEVNHIDGVKDNNCIGNLEYVSPSENIRHAFSSKLMLPQKGECNPSSSHSEDEVRSAWALMLNGATPKQAHVATGVSYDTCKAMYARKAWTHICVEDLPKLKPKNNFFGVKRMNSGKFKSYVFEDGRQKTLGTYSSEQTAAKVREDYLDNHPNVRGKRNAIPEAIQS